MSPSDILTIKMTVAQSCGITVSAMDSPSRPEHIVWPRQIAMSEARERTRMSLDAIGKAFGGRDHGTVIHAVKRVHERHMFNAHDREQIDHIRSRLNNAPAPWVGNCPVPDA